VLNMEATIQTHLFEDRVMKMSRVNIGARCSVGACAVVLYDTAMGDGPFTMSRTAIGPSLSQRCYRHLSPAPSRKPTG